ncbi:MAG: iron export ABC transporter permease subunit FetB [Methylobacter sp.]|uniref:ABC transporter permease n=1 Tax=Methylobacter sp. TaxID=2051955 RepID=UPI002725E5CB|nr:iron export ABC transporter permease subunit FetB [Methylobacter sp.]MDO9269924.1 iron export ABC transporter permease subunit FetB [Methylobacter sp.]MDP1667144.1 iron export ABC transporter permease subunit FetB [Methylobacter sp.]MDP1970705.1 iron export ABC transporter permease subunit FetB [Methylobacter sp.]
METLDIELPRMALLYGLCLLPWIMLRLIGLRLSRDIGISILRMSIQLALVGIYLKMLFDLNHPWLNGLWILVMLLVADLSILRRAGLKARYFVLATFMAIASSILFSTAYLVILVIQPTHFYDARYIVPLAGMILGNCLQGNVIALERFYSTLRKNENEYATFLMLGATRWEAVRPYFRDAVKAALNPTIAGMATMGLVSLPGMMTGQILGGSEPWLAVKYQIAIMICIFTSTTIACIINLKLSLNIAFNTFDVLRDEVIDKP